MRYPRTSTSSWLGAWGRIPTGRRPEAAEMPTDSASPTVEAMPLTRSAVAKLVTELQTATVRLEHMTRVAWGIARQVAPDVATDLVTVRTSIRQAGGSRAVLTA